MPDMMPKEQALAIERIKNHCLDATNMTEEEAYNFAFRCWQLNYVRADKKEVLYFRSGSRAGGKTQALILQLDRENARLTAENEQLRERHASLDRQIRKKARREFAEKIKNYYIKNHNSIKGSINCDLVAYQIEQILTDMERKEEQCL